MSIPKDSVQFTASVLAVAPGDPIVAEYPVPTADSGPYSIAAGANHTLWFTEYWKGNLASLNSQSGTIHEFTIPESNSQPVGVAVDSQNRIWIADENNPGGLGRIWQFNPAIGVNGTFTPYVTKTRNPINFFVIVDSSGNVWFSELQGNNLAEIPSGVTSVTEYALPTANAGPSVLTIQNGTSYIWISEYFSNRLARFDTVTHTFQEFNPSPAPKSPLGIAADLAGNIWVSEHGGSSVDQFIVSNSTLRKYPTAEGSGNITAPATVSVDNRGRVWFVEHVSNKVGRLDPIARSTDEFQFQNPGIYSLQGFGSTLDSSGNFWFTLFTGNSIGMIPGNASTELRVAPATSDVTTVVGGQSASLSFVVSNPSAVSFSVLLNPTSTFSTSVTGNRVSLSTGSMSLAAHDNKTIKATITPDTYSSPGLYGVGIVATSANVSTIGIVFVIVQPSLLYTIGAYLPEIALVAVAGAVLAVFLLVRRRSLHRPRGSLSTPKLSLILIAILSFVMFGLASVDTVQAKCPGLPPPPVQPNGTQAPDYFGYALDIVSVAFFGIVAYFLIKDRLKSRKPIPPGQGNSSS